MGLELWCLELDLCSTAFAIEERKLHPLKCRKLTEEIMRTIEQSAIESVSGGFLPALYGAYRCVAGASGGMAAYGAQAMTVGSATSGCGAVVSAVAGCGAGLASPIVGAGIGVAGAVGSSLCDRGNVYSGSSRDYEDANYENEFDRQDSGGDRGKLWRVETITF